MPKVPSSNTVVDLNTPARKPVLAVAVTAPVSMAFFQGQLDFLCQAGFEIVVICSPGWDSPAGIRYYPIPMKREISLLSDLQSLLRLIRLLMKLKPDLINAGTPKAGLLGMLAAYLCRVPVRVYTCHGLRLETLAGIKRLILTMTEKVAAFCAQRVICVSPSLREKVVQQGLAPLTKTVVIGAGSCNGIDLAKFSPVTDAGTQADPLHHYGTIAPDAAFIGFVGRLTRDKGIYELISAFATLKKNFSNLYLLLVGGFEAGDPVSDEVRDKIDRDERIINLGEVADPLPYYQMMKILVLPTYREGLPTVLLEAGAMGIPVVATRATGCIDIVHDGETGLLVDIGDVNALTAKLELLLQDEGLAKKLGHNARKRMNELYRQELVWENIANFYWRLLSQQPNTDWVGEKLRKERA